MQRTLIQERFSSCTDKLRAHFDQRFADPRKARGDRFVWDYWHVPGQYTALRTPAWEYFPKPLYERWHRQVVAFGREQLGCHDISPPWLSVYVEGCRQELHADLPHGPFAFVHSLTRWSTRTFRGGQTLLLRDSILDHWASGAHDPESRGLEEDGILESIDAELGRLVVFDPRIPHGVRRVEGTHDPREGRVVLHGWFVQPRPFLQGPHDEHELAEQIEILLGRLPSQLPAGIPLSGTLTVRFSIAPSGTVSQAKRLISTLRAPLTERALCTQLERWLLRELRTLRFSRAPRSSVATLPLVFD